MKTEQKIFDELMAHGPNIKCQVHVADLGNLVDYGTDVPGLIDELNALVLKFGTSLRLEKYDGYDGYDGYNIDIFSVEYESEKEQRTRCKQDAAAEWNRLNDKELKKIAKANKKLSEERELYETLKKKFES